MVITFKGIEQIEGFISDLHNRLDAKLEDLPCIISQMGISGERIEVEFTECLSDKDIFVVRIMDDIMNSKAYRCEMLLGSMINPYPGFSCNDGKNIKYYSWDGKELEFIHEVSEDERRTRSKPIWHRRIRRGDTNPDLNKQTVIRSGSHYEEFCKSGKRYRMPVEGQARMKSANSFYTRESLKPHFLDDEPKTTEKKDEQ